MIENELTKEQLDEYVAAFNRLSHAPVVNVPEDDMFGDCGLGVEISNKDYDTLSPFLHSIVEFGIDNIPGCERYKFSGLMLWEHGAIVCPDKVYLLVSNENERNCICYLMARELCLLSIFAGKSGCTGKFYGPLYDGG